LSSCAREATSGRQDARFPGRCHSAEM